MYTSKQLDLIKRFYAAIGILTEEKTRFDPANAKYILHNLVVTDAVKSEDISEVDIDSQRTQIAVFNSLENYYKKDLLAKKFIKPFWIFLPVAAIVEFFKAEWKIGIGLLLACLLIPSALYMLILSFLAPGFGPLKLGLTQTECQFALDEIIGHERWRS